MADQNISLAVTGRNEAKRALNDVINDLGRTQKAINNTTSSAKKMQGGFKGLGRGAGQAGIQFQQLIGQIQGGVNPMVALSQQSADLGFVLGVPLVGAVVSIAAALSTILLPSLLEADDALKDFKQTAKDAEVDLKKVAPGLFAQEQEKLAKAVRDAELALQKELLAVNEIDAQFDRARKRLENFGAASVGLAGETDPLAVLQERLAEAIKNQGLEVEKAEINLIAAKKALKEFGEETDFSTPKVDEATEAVKKLNTVILKIPKVAPNPVTDSTEVQDITNIWTETDKFTVSQQRLGEATKMTAMTLEDVGKKSLSSMEDSLVDLISGTKSVAGAFKDMARSIVSDLIRMYIQQQITAPLFNSMFGQTPTTYTTIAPAGPPTVGGTEVFFEGGGYTGNGHRVGGVDGRGGFPAILHPNETIIDHQKGQSGSGGVTVNLNITTGVSQTVRAEIANLMPQIANATKAAVADARMRGGSFSGAMGV